MFLNIIFLVLNDLWFTTRHVMITQWDAKRDIKKDVILETDIVWFLHETDLFMCVFMSLSFKTLNYWWIFNQSTSLTFSPAVLSPQGIVLLLVLLQSIRVFIFKYCPWSLTSWSATSCLIHPSGHFLYITLISSPTCSYLHYLWTLLGASLHENCYRGLLPRLLFRRANKTFPAARSPTASPLAHLSHWHSSAPLQQGLQGAVGHHNTTPSTICVTSPSECTHTYTHLYPHGLHCSWSAHHFCLNITIISYTQSAYHSCFSPRPHSIGAVTRRGKADTPCLPAHLCCYSYQSLSLPSEPKYC